MLENFAEKRLEQKLKCFLRKISQLGGMVRNLAQTRMYHRRHNPIRRWPWFSEGGANFVIPRFFKKKIAFLTPFVSFSHVFESFERTKLPSPSAPFTNRSSPKHF